MNSRLIYAAVVAASLLSSAAVMAADASGAKTREEVKAELADAIRTGNIADNEFAQPLNQLYPSRYPAPAVASARSRVEVKTELAAAVRSGHLVTDLEIPTVAERDTRLVAASGKTRAQVKAELAEAVRTGNIVDDETHLKLNELHPAQYRGQSASSGKAGNGGKA